MDLETLLSFEWGIMMPEFIILGVAAILTLFDLFMPKNQDRKILAGSALWGFLLQLFHLLDCSIMGQLLFYMIRFG